MSIIKLSNENIKKEDGISLLEVAIGVIILGLITLPLIRSYKIDVVRKALEVSSTSGILSTQAINHFYKSGNSHYPCPADLSLEEGDVDFGKAGDCTLSNIKVCASPVWFTSGGICKTAGGPNSVIIGGIPFADLNMRHERSLDYWGNKLIYAVTFEQTDELTFLANPGEVNVMVVASTGGAPYAKVSASPYDFFIFSTGASAIGGYTKNGDIISACGDYATEGYDNENCDFDDTFFFSLKGENARNELPGSLFFDDITLAQESIPEDMWYQHPDNFSYADDFIITSAARIGIGTQNPTETIDVVGLPSVPPDLGDIRVRGMLKTDQVCDAGSANCFNPILITGTEDAMECDADNSLYGKQAVVRLANSQVSCASAVDTASVPIEGETLQVDTSVVSGNPANPSGECNLGDVVSGINASGEIICVTP